MPSQDRLDMTLTDLPGRSLPDIDAISRSVPYPYRLRTYQAGDEAAWAQLMVAGDLGSWDVERVVSELTGVAWPQFDPQGLFMLVTPNDELVGSACAWLTRPEETVTGTLHMVCVAPKHRGHGLGRYVCTAVLARFRDRGFRETALVTQTYRTAAVRLYLKLGFRPVYREPDAKARWAGVFDQIGWTEPALGRPRLPEGDA